jgi:signal transduction histidine kinase
VIDGPFEILLLGALAALAATFLIVAYRDRQQARAAKAEAAVLARAVAEAPDGLLLWTSDPADARLSPSLARQIEADERAGAGSFLARLVEPDRSELGEAFRRIASEGSSVDRRVRDSDGRIWRVTAGRSADANGDTCFAWLRDVTAAERTAEERAHMQANLDAREAMLDRVPLPVWYRRPGSLDLAYRNKAAEVLVGDGGPADRVGRGLAQRALRSGNEQTESTNIVIDGRRCLIEIVESPAPDGAAIGHARDVTQLAETQDELARHVAAHGELLQKLTTAIAIYGRDKRLRLFNTAFVELWQLDRRWLATEPDFSAVIELLRHRRRLPEYADFAQAKRQWTQLFTGLIDPVEEFLHLPDGRTIRQTVSPHPQGGLLFAFDDVSDRVAVERSYNTLIAVQRETLDSLGEAIAAFTGDGRLQISNPAFARLWKLDDAFVAQKPHLNEVSRRIGELLAESAGLAGLELAEGTRETASGRVERLDGSVLDFARVALPDGATLLIYQDVTDSLRVERALRDRNEALETADRLKTEFIANVSYELRTPLNAIVGFAQVLTDQYFGGLNERQLDHARAIITASDRLVMLINDILDLSSIEAGYLALNRADIDIASLMHQVTGMSNEAIRGRGLALSVDCPASIGNMRVDEVRLKQVLLNLVSNSAKFTPRGGHILISARREPTNIVFRVADTGIGIERERQAQIFEPFVRGAAIQGQAGAGLGLALVRRLIELHGGSVELDSEPGTGTTVELTLPAA